MAPTSILHLPSLVSISPHTKHYLIYFITGNPGYIGYYKTFLSTLQSLLSPPSSSSNAAFHIYGQSLKGFDDEEDTRKNGPFGLRTVTDSTYQNLKQQRIQVGERAGQAFDGVVLIAHSVGSYIALECLRSAQLDAASDPSTPLKPIAAILLFPTVTHIAQSPSGVRISTLFKLPNFPRLAHLAVQGLFWPLSDWMMKSAVAKVTGMPDDASAVTAGFLRSGKGVWQALHMARDEMDVITEDRWDEDIWGIEHEDEDEKKEGRKLVPKLVFYFGQNDHWVADHTRDALIAARGGNGAENKKSAPKMLVDQDGIPHGFSVGMLSPIPISMLHLAVF